jgi:hypothetical protein
MQVSDWSTLVVVVAIWKLHLLLLLRRSLGQREQWWWRG